MINAFAIPSRAFYRKPRNRGNSSLEVIEPTALRLERGANTQTPNSKLQTTGFGRFRMESGELEFEV
jgi:hypothetical protein